MAATAATEEAPALTVQIPESSRSSLSASASASVDSSLSASSPGSLSTPNHSSILRTSTSFTLPTRPSVAFAPLPSIEPRRRKSNIQLGVAARSRLIHHRRILREQGLHPSLASLHSAPDVPPPIPVWDHELEDDDDDDDDGDGLGMDPAEEAFAAIGKFVKGATRTLFRRISHRDSSKKRKSPNTLPDATPDNRDNEPTPYTSDHLYHDDSYQAQVEREEGGIWKEEVGGDTWQKQRAKTLPEARNGTHDDNINSVCKCTNTTEVLEKNSFAILNSMR